MADPVYVISKNYLDREVINALTGGTLVPLNSTQLNGKAQGYFVDTATTQTINGVKNFSDVNSLRFNASNTAFTTPNTQSVATHPFGTDTYHDHLAFLRSHSIIDKKVTTDGTNWTDSTLDIIRLFINKESNNVQIIKSTDMGFKFTMYSGGQFHACLISWFEFGVNYSSTFTNVNVTVECSSDNSTWITLSSGVINTTTTTFFVKSAGWPSNQKYLRFTFMKQTSGNGYLDLNCIKALTYRKGNQGLGSEYKYPYKWDMTNDVHEVTPIANNTWNLGTSSEKWLNVYATNFVGKASSADVSTNSTKINGYNLQVVTSMPSSPDASTIYILKG